MKKRSMQEREMSAAWWARCVNYELLNTLAKHELFESLHRDGIIDDRTFEAAMVTVQLAKTELGRRLLESGVAS